MSKLATGAILLACLLAGVTILSPTAVADDPGSGSSFITPQQVLACLQGAYDQCPCQDVCSFNDIQRPF